MNINPFILLDEEDSRFIPIGKEIIKMINDYPLTYELSEDALISLLKLYNEKDENNKYLYLKIIDKDDTLIPLHINGTNLMEEGIIIIRELEDIWLMFSFLLFELLNIRNFNSENKEDLELIIKDRWKDKGINKDKGQEKFANMMEHIECYTINDHHNLISKGIKMYSWPKYLKTSNKVIKETCNAEESKHKQAYRDLYRNL
jgi:hypothetical protein